MFGFDHEILADVAAHWVNIVLFSLQVSMDDQ